MDPFPDYSWLLKAFVRAANAPTVKRFAVLDGSPPKTRRFEGDVSTPDARPVGRDRHILIQPDGEGLWEVHEWDEGGGSLWAELSKVEALAIGLDYVLKLGATLTLKNNRDG